MTTPFPLGSRIRCQCGCDCVSEGPVIAHSSDEGGKAWYVVATDYGNRVIPESLAALVPTGLDQILELAGDH